MAPTFRELGQCDSMEALSSVPCNHRTNVSYYATDGILYTVCNVYLVSPTVSQSLSHFCHL